MQGWLTIEQDYITVHHMSFNGITKTDVFGNEFAIAILQKLFDFRSVFHGLFNEIGSRMNIGTVDD